MSTPYIIVLSDSEDDLPHSPMGGFSGYAGDSDAGTHSPPFTYGEMVSTSLHFMSDHSTEGFYPSDEPEVNMEISADFQTAAEDQANTGYNQTSDDLIPEEGDMEIEEEEEEDPSEDTVDIPMDVGTTTPLPTPPTTTTSPAVPTPRTYTPIPPPIPPRGLTRANARKRVAPTPPTPRYHPYGATARRTSPGPDTSVAGPSTRTYFHTTHYGSGPATISVPRKSVRPPHLIFPTTTLPESIPTQIHTTTTTTAPTPTPVVVTTTTTTPITAPTPATTTTPTPVPATTTVPTAGHVFRQWEHGIVQHWGHMENVPQCEEGQSSTAPIPAHTLSILVARLAHQLSDHRALERDFESYIARNSSNTRNAFAAAHHDYVRTAHAVADQGARVTHTQHNMTVMQNRIEAAEARITQLEELLHNLSGSSATSNNSATNQQ